MGGAGGVSTGGEGNCWQAPERDNVSKCLELLAEKTLNNFHVLFGLYKVIYSAINNELFHCTFQASRTISK